MHLSGMAVGSQAELASIELDHRLVIRLMELGLIPGSVVRFLGRSAGSVRVAIGATRIAVADEYADRILLAESASVSEPEPTDMRSTRSIDRKASS